MRRFGTWGEVRGRIPLEARWDWISELETGWCVWEMRGLVGGLDVEDV